MNSLFNSAHKKSGQLRADLDNFASAPVQGSAALQGQISATLTGFARTIDQYSDKSKDEFNAEKQAKARERVRAFRAELTDYRQRFDSLKRTHDEAQAAQNRTELLGRRPHQASTPENPYAAIPNQSIHSSGSATANGHANPLFAGRAAPSSSSHDAYTATAEAHAYREASFFSQGNAQLDEYLERGRAVLGDLGRQREVLKGTQRRLYDVAGTLGISGDTIRMVERRAKQDRWIFWGGVVVFFGFCWLVLRYLR